MAYKSLENLSKDVVNCKKCQLYKSRTKAVPGIGNAKSKILFVGEAPGANEDIKGIPFTRYIDILLLWVWMGCQ